MSALYSIWNFLSGHKNWLAIMTILLLVGVVDENSLWHRRTRQQTIEDLRQQIAAYQQKYEADSRALDRLVNDPAALERIAREKYYMHRDCEDIYVVEGSDRPAELNEEIAE